MFPVKNNYYDDSVSSIKVDSYQKAIEYRFNNSRTEKVKFANTSDFDNALAELSQNFILIKNNVWYRLNSISVISINALAITYFVNGVGNLTKVYADQDEVDTAVEKFEPMFIKIGNKWYNGYSLHVADADKVLFRIRFHFDNGVEKTEQYLDITTMEDVLTKLEQIGSNSGSGEAGDRTKTPTFTVPAGYVPEGTTLKIECETEDATIFYTTDGTEPTLESTEYDGSDITVPEDGITVKAIAVKLGLSTSKIASAQYHTSLYNKAYYKGWWDNVETEEGTAETITATEVTHLEGISVGEATSCDTPDPNIYTVPENFEGGRIVWAYPKEFGACTKFKDSLGTHDIADSYTQVELEIKGIEYYVYVLTDPISTTPGTEYDVVFFKD